MSTQSDAEGLQSPPARSIARRWIGPALITGAVLVPLLVRQELRSVEHANRTYRGGDPEGAAGLYQRSLDRHDEDPIAFNLGTALLAIDTDSAKVLLRRVAQADDRATAQRGFYNLGYGQLLASELSTTPDSILPELRAAVRSYRSALRLDPTDQDARWNLSLAIRKLQSLLPPGEDTGEESGSESDDEVPMNDPQLARSESAPAEAGPEPDEPRPTDNQGERRGPREGAREAWALQDPGPLTTARALELLGTVIDQPEELLKGILWSHRPDIAWWTGQAYPGGNW